MVSSWAPRFRKIALEQALKPAAIAAAFVLAALLCTFPLQRIIAYPFVFLFFGAIIGSAWIGGAIAGVLAVLLSSLAVNYFFIPPVYSISVAKEAQTFLAAFIACAILVAILSSARKRAERAVRAANDRLESMVHERTAELLQSNQEIREREGRLRELTEAIPQQIWRANDKGAVDHLNQRLREYLGDELSQPGEAFFARILHPDDEPIFRARWAEAVFRAERLEAEARVRGADGAYRWFLIRGNPQRSSDGRVACWYGTLIDIEEQRRAQQGLVTAQDELARAARNLTMAEMAAAIAHELNQPLAAVMNHAYACHEWLRAATPNLPKATATAEKIVQESARASEVLRRVRALFQKEAPEWQPVDVNLIIADLARLLRDEAIRRGLSIRTELAGDLPKVEADPVLIRQALLNLAANGMEAMSQSKGELLIRSEANARAEVVVSVQDRGPGVPDSLRAKIFDPFFSTKPDGAGMGLAICRSIMEAHGGRLTVTNLDGGGACFQFSLRANA
jgi:PAS domain S-box-containing protein